MSGPNNPPSAARPRYAIRVRGHLGPQSATRFEGMTLTHTAEGHTLLIGDIADQAALHGVLRQVRDAGLELLSLYRVDTNDNQNHKEN